jgi:hypothetical protein
MESNTCHPPGQALVQAIKERAMEQGLNVGQTAAVFQLSPSYWASICSGVRPVQALRHARLRRMADFLGRPFIEVLSLAELVEPEDFIVHQTIDDRLNAVYRLMKADSLWSALVPKEDVWDQADRQFKLMLARMYLKLALEALADHDQAAAAAG